MGQKALWLSFLSFLLPACVDAGLTPEDEAAVRREDLATSNALTTNALTSNALTSNALTSNALTSNALTSNALTSNALTSNALTSNEMTPSGLTQGELSRQLLKYAYSCAMPAGTSMQLVIGGVDYGLFEGSIGIAPQWATGACNTSCQRWVTACVLARVNFYGVPVPVSMRTATGSLVTTEAEKAQYPNEEGAFYGNMFNGSGMLWACAGKDQTKAQLQQRLCAGGASCGMWVGTCRGYTICTGTYQGINCKYAGACGTSYSTNHISGGSYSKCYDDGDTLSFYGHAGSSYTEVVTIYTQ